MKVTTMVGMFMDATSFNGDNSNCDVPRVADMGGAFMETYWSTV